MRIVQRQREMDQAKKKKKKKAKKKILRKETKKIIKQQAAKAGWLVTQISEWKLALTKPFTNDRIEVDIEKRGIVKFNVPGIISAVNHTNAENFLRDTTHKLGAKVISLFHKVGAAIHSHAHHHHHGSG